MGKKGLHKSLQIYLSKLKKVPCHLHIPNSPHPAAASWLLSACKYPCRTPSFAADRDGAPDDDDDAHDPAATLSDVDRFLHENFHSLYAREDDVADGGFSSSESPRYDDEDPPPAAVRSSERFFVSPGTSNSLLEEARPSGVAATASSSSPSCSSDAGPGGGVAVMTFSKDPYRDFRRSMQDMVEARHADPSLQALDWDFMEELLFCYLELNDRSVHKHILRAFTDLAVSFRRRVTAGRRRTPAGNKECWKSRRSGKGPADVLGVNT